MPDNRTLEQLVEDWAPRLSRAFLDAVQAMRDRVQIGLLVEMLERGDIDGAIRAVGLDPAAFRALDAGIAQTFEAGGRLTTDHIPATREPGGYLLKAQFNIRNPAAEQWLREFGADLITEIERDTREMVRQRLVEGIERGENPRTVALDLTGRVNPATGIREGGLIGLTSSQAQWVRAYEARLRSGDPAQMREALEMSLRDKRYDRTVEKAIRDGVPVPADKVAKMVAAYKNGALSYRAETIGRLEAMTALSEGRDQGWRQAIAKGQVKAEHLIKTWKSAKDDKVRGTHRALDGKIVGFDEVFVSPSGATLRYPHDRSAPLSETAGCRCTASYRLDYTGKIRKENDTAELRRRILQSAVAADATERVYAVNVSAVNDLWKADGDFYIGPGLGDAKTARAVDFLKALQPGEEWTAPSLGVTNDGVGFSDGRHRFAAMRELGLDVAPVSMDAGSYIAAIERGIIA